MKRIASLFIILLVVSGFLFAGGGGQSGGSKTITFYYWNEAQQEGMDPTVNAYMKATGNKVETTIIPFAQYWTKLQTSLPSDTGPDVWWNNMAHGVDYFPLGLAQEIQTYVTRDKVDMSVFPKPLIDAYTYNGKLYGIPKDYDVIGLWYNKALFDAKGVSYPTDDWTWADLRNAAEKLRDGNKTWPFVSVPSGQVCFYSWVLSNNGTLMTPDNRTFHLNSPETIAALTELKKYIDDGLSPTVASQAEMVPRTLFEGGLAAMLTDGNWRAPNFYAALGDKVGSARFPISKRRANVIHGLAFCMSAKSRYKEEAWGLVKAFASKEAGEAQAKVVFPAYKGTEQLFLANYPTIKMNHFVEAANYADPIPTATIASAEQGAIVTGYMERMFRGDISIAEGCAAIDRECEAIAKEAEAAKR